MYRIAAYRGDPFSIGGLIGGVAKFAGGILPGPAGAVLKAAGGLLAPKRPQLPSPSQITQVGPGGLIYKRTEFGAQVTPPSMRPLGTGGCEKGFHQSKRTGACVRNRSMNALNPRALRRAATRLNSFKRHAKSMAKALGQPISFGSRGRSSSPRKCGCK